LNVLAVNKELQENTENQIKHKQCSTVQLPSSARMSRTLQYCYIKIILVYEDEYPNLGLPTAHCTTVLSCNFDTLLFSWGLLKLQSGVNRLNCFQSLQSSIIFFETETED